MIRVSAALVAAFATAGAAQVAPGQGAPAEIPAEVRAQIDACDRYKFETIVETSEAGKPRRQRVRICGTEAKDDADWKRTLTDLIGKTEASAELSAQAKVQIVTALRNEIAKLDLAASPAAAPAPAVAIADAPAAPALPPPAVSPPRAPVAAAARPRLTILCFLPGQGSSASCGSLEKDTRIDVRADAALARGATLRFLRRGELRGEVSVPALRSGETRRFALPRPLCAGVSSSRVEIEIRDTAGTGFDTLGPFPLRC